jgi:hypothetical protein
MKTKLLLAILRQLHEPSLDSADRRRFLTLLLGAAAGTAFFEIPALAQGQQQAPDEEFAWVCPMHTDYTADVPGVCPFCGMTLVRATPFDVRDYQLEFRTEPAVVKAGEKITLYFKFLHPGSGDVITGFTPVHEKLLHLFVISQNMEYFQHIHPVMAPDGTWSIDTTLPKPGYYKVLFDFLPSGGSSQFLSRALVTAGYAGDLEADSAHLVPDKVLKKTVDDITASVAYDPDQFVAGMYGHLNYYLTDAKTGAPIIDLQTYLGAFGHMLIMSEDMVQYVHSHPVNVIIDDDGGPMEFIIPPDADLEKIRGGPGVTFDALMPKPGNYRAWSQFQRNNKIYTFAFTFNAVPGTE